MHIVRRHPAADADIIQGKICVTGGNYSARRHWIEVYDPKTQTWEPLPKKKLDLTTQKSVFSHGMLVGGKHYTDSGGKCRSRPKQSFIKLENVWYGIGIYKGKLYFEDTMVKGLEELSTKHLCAVSKSGGGRVTVWWKTVESTCYKKKRKKDFWCVKTKIWCAKISLERRSPKKVWGIIEWSSNVLTFDKCVANNCFFLNSAVVTS